VDFVRHVAALAWKDLRVEFRSREIVYTMVLFAALIVVLFSFAFVKENAAGEMAAVADVAPGFVWIPVLFAATLGLSRAFDREREGDTMRGLLLSPTPRAAIFLGKALGIAALMVLCELVVVPLVVVLFDAPLFDAPIALSLILVGTTIGIAVVGSTFAAMLMRTRSRDVLLPIVLYPILVPLLIAAIKATAGCVAHDPVQIRFWIRFLLAYDAIFVVAALWIFESLVIE
jgi:heme exporter protein CcmB